MGMIKDDELSDDTFWQHADEIVDRIADLIDNRSLLTSGVLRGEPARITTAIDREYDARADLRQAIVELVTTILERTKT